MAFVFSQEPNNWMAAIRERVGEFLAPVPTAGAVALHQMADSNEVPPPASNAIPLAASNVIPRFQLSCRQAQEGGIKAASVAGWRTLVFRGESEKPTVALDFSRQGNSFEVEGCLEDDALETFVQALEVAKERSETKDFELRLLESPGLLFSALWLHGVEEDSLIPLTHEGPFRALEPIPLEAADGLLREKAGKQLQVLKKYRGENN